MSTGKTVLQGSTLEKNGLPPRAEHPFVTLNGIFCGKRASFDLTEDVLSKHMMLIGGTGCGKSTLFYHLIHQIRSKMTEQDVMLIFDTKGDYYSRFARTGDVLIGNSAQYYEHSGRWNVFKEILADGWDERLIRMNTMEICKALFSDRKNSQNPFFPNAGRDLLTALIMHLIRVSLGNKQMMNQVLFNDALYNYLNNSTREDFLDDLDQESDMRAVQSYISDDGGQSQGVLSELYSVIRDLFLGVFAERGAFSIRNFVRKKGGHALFIEYDLSVGSVLTPIYKLIFDLALKEVLGRSKSAGNVYLICDEFKLLPNLQHIDDGVNFGRSLGVKVIAGLQSIEQLTEIYGPSRGKNLAAGFSTTIAFRANDVTTRNFVSELHGKNLVLEQYRTLDSRYVEEKRSGCVVEDWDMNHLKVGEAIVGLPFSPPFKFYFDMYDG